MYMDWAMGVSHPERGGKEDMVESGFPRLVFSTKLFVLYIVRPFPFSIAKLTSSITPDQSMFRPSLSMDEALTNSQNGLTG